MDLLYFMVVLISCRIYHQDKLARRICDFTSSARRTVARSSSTPRYVSKNVVRQGDVTHGNLEIDNHADTIVLGKNCTLLHLTGRECDVSPYTDDYDAIKSVPIATGATAWTSPATAETIIIVLHEGLWMPEQCPNTLVNPNQLRYHGTVVRDNPFDAEQMSIESEDASFYIPMYMNGTTVHAETRTPTSKELETCRHVHLSSKQPWEPHQIKLPQSGRDLQQEIRLLEAREIGATKTTHDFVDIPEVDANFAFSIDDLQARLIQSVVVHDDYNDTTIGSVDTQQPDVPDIRSFESSERHSDVSPKSLSERWGIGFRQAKKTLKHTTQRIVRSAIMPLSRRYRADRIYQKKRLDGKWFTDTMDSHVKSLDGNRYAQVFSNKRHFQAIYPMSSKGQAGEALRLFCLEFGIPAELTFDGSKEQTCKGTEFMKQVRKNDIKFHIIEPERHNQNPCEGVIRELRKKWFRTMINNNVPRRLWDYGYRWVSEIMQRTYVREGRLDAGVPIENVTGETWDISEYLDFGFYNWIWYWDLAGLGDTTSGNGLGSPTAPDYNFATTFSQGHAASFPGEPSAE